jgi:hypothetical protein
VCDCSSYDEDGDGSNACDDCDDSDPTTYPGATEICDGADNDCNGQCDDIEAAVECATVQRDVFSSVADTDIAQDYGSWAAGAYPALSTGFSPNVHRTLTYFDVSFIPTGSTIVSADASWYVQWNTHHQTVRAHRIVQPWAEATASWTNFGSISNFDATVLGSFDGFGGITYKSVSLTGMYQGIVDGAQPDYGVLLESDVPPSAPGQKYVYSSSETSSVSKRPKLDICWMETCNAGCGM